MLTRSGWAWAACAVLLCVATARPASADPLTVKTDLGRVHGKTINSGKVRAFLGIPYAAPPMGALRWKAPQPAAKWSVTREFTAYAPHCAQGAVFDDMTFQDNGGSEDCLYLNIYAPTKGSEKSKLPVMFWIHGGGYLGGGSDEPRHNGDFLPLKGVVLVTINYRLGVFGFLATKELAQEANGVAGNYGLADMIAALHWVHDNIEGFGGDPNNVTIFGESAGSFAVSTLMASPEARGLVARAIGESGGAFPSAMNLGGDSVEERSKVDEAWMTEIGAKSIKDLRAMTTEQILEGAKKARGGFSPVVDGKVLTEPVVQAFAEGKQLHIPLLAGWNADEGNFFVAQGMSAEKWKSMAKGIWGDRAEEFLKLYPGNTDAEAYRSAIDYGSDSFIAFGTWKWLEAHRKTGDAPVYRYHFELAATPSKFHPGTFAFHSDDIEYVFGTLDTRPGWTVRPEDRKLSNEMMSYWANFARTGDPNGPGLPTWPKYGAGDELLHLNDPITAGPDALRPRYEFLLKGIPPMHY